MVTKELRDNLNNSKNKWRFSFFAVALEEGELCVTVGLLGNTHVQTLISVQNSEDVTQFGEFL